MRIIAQRIAQAIKQNKSIHIDNTEYNANSGEVRLHSHRILYRVNDHFMIDRHTVEQWPTNTTKSRINDISRCMGARSLLYQKDFIFYYVSINYNQIPVSSFENDLFAFAVNQ